MCGPRAEQTPAPGLQPRAGRGPVSLAEFGRSVGRGKAAVRPGRGRPPPGLLRGKLRPDAGAPGGPVGKRGRVSEGPRGGLGLCGETWARVRDGSGSPGRARAAWREKGSGARGEALGSVRCPASPTGAQRRAAPRSRPEHPSRGAGLALDAPSGREGALLGRGARACLLALRGRVGSLPNPGPEKVGPCGLGCGVSGASGGPVGSPLGPRG